MDEEVKEWVKVTRSADGKRFVSVTLQKGNLTAKYAVKCWGLKDQIKNGVKEAREAARADLKELEEAVFE